MLYIYRLTIPLADGLVGSAVAVLMLVLIAAVPPVFMRGAAASEAFGRAQAGLEVLSRQLPAAEGTCRAHAVAILALPSCPAGIWSKNTFDVRGAAAKLGSALAFVQAVEQALIADRGIKPTFTELAH